MEIDNDPTHESNSRLSKNLSSVSEGSTEGRKVYKQAEFGDVHGLQTLVSHPLQITFVQMLRFMVIFTVMSLYPNIFELLKMEVLHLKWLQFQNGKSHIFCESWVNNFIASWLFHFKSTVFCVEKQNPKNCQCTQIYRPNCINKPAVWEWSCLLQLSSPQFYRQSKVCCIQLQSNYIRFRSVRFLRQQNKETPANTKSLV